MKNSVKLSSNRPYSKTQGQGFASKMKGTNFKKQALLTPAHMKRSFFKHVWMLTGLKNLTLFKDKKTMSIWP